MSYLGYMAWRRTEIHFFTCIVSAIIGTYIGTICAYFIGLKYGEGILLKYGKFVHITKDRLEMTEILFRKNEVALLLFSRYIPGVRHIVPYLCGISRMCWNKFLLLNFIGSAIWCVTFIGIGYYLGDKWEIVEEMLREYILILVFILVSAYLIYRGFRKFLIREKT